MFLLPNVSLFKLTPKWHCRLWMGYIERQPLLGELNFLILTERYVIPLARLIQTIWRRHRVQENSGRPLTTWQIDSSNLSKSQDPICTGFGFINEEQSLNIENILLASICVASSEASFPSYYKKLIHSFWNNLFNYHM